MYRALTKSLEICTLSSLAAGPELICAAKQWSTVTKGVVVYTGAIAALFAVNGLVVGGTSVMQCDSWGKLPGQDVFCVMALQTRAVMVTWQQEF